MAVPTVTVEDTPVTAQVVAAREPDPSTVTVSETTVVVDEFVLDPEAENAVQTDGGEGDASTPIGRASADTPEDVFEDAEGS